MNRRRSITVTGVVTRGILFLLLGFVPVVARSGQIASPPGVIRITVNLVQVDAVVTDSKGRQVANLKPEDFEILEDGRPQAITNFSYIHVTAPPGGVPSAQPTPPGVPYVPPAPLRPEQVRRTIVVVVDDLHIRFENLEYARKALRQFLDEDIGPSDLVAILHTSGGLGVLQQFTNDKAILHEAIRRIHYGISTPCGLFGLHSDLPEELGRCCATVTSVATFDALDYTLKGLRGLPGRKALILLSDEPLMSPGIRQGNFQDRREASGRSSAKQSPAFPSSEASMQDMLRELVDLANRSSTVLYAMDTRGLPTLQLNASEDLTGLPPIWGGPESLGPAPRQVATTLMNRQVGYLSSEYPMAYLAERTGGLFVHDKNDLAGGMREIMDDLAGYYLIGYKPPADAFNADKKRLDYHRIQVKVKIAGLHVRSRTGFYGVPEEETRHVRLTPVEQLHAAVVSPFGASGIHVEFAPQLLYEGGKDSIARLWLHVDGRGLALKDLPDGSKKATLEMLALVFGDNGAAVGDLGRTFNDTFQPYELDGFRKDGVNYHLDFPIRRPGGYQLRLAVRDPVSQKVGSASQFIEVPDLRHCGLALSGIVLNSDTVGNEGPATRLFRPGDRVRYQLEIYNARRSKGDEPPNLESTVHIFRSGHAVSTGRPGAISQVPWDSKVQVMSGELALGPNMAPGHYALQVNVTDMHAPAKHATAGQWIDFAVTRR